MAETNAEKRALHVDDEAADRVLLVAQPRIAVLLPHILGAAHDDHGVVWIERGNRFAAIEFGHLPSGAILPKKLAKHAEMLDFFVLQNKNSHRRSRLPPAATDCRKRPPRTIVTFRPLR